jgi:hypothetical protein
MEDFKKVSKEEWFKMSQTERDYLTLQFNKSVESRKKTILWVTRGAAILCILALFYIGYAQLKAAENYGKIHDKYGKDAYCYLCGVESLRKCECVYWQLGYRPDNMTDYQKRMGEYNIKSCIAGPTVAEGAEGATNFNPFNISLDGF